MSVQTTIANDPALGVPGMLYDSEDHDTVSLIANVDIPFGSYVRIVGQTCELPDATGEVSGDQGGVALHAGGESGGYKAGDIVNVLRRGRVIVATETALVNGAKPFVRFAATPPEQLGAFRNDADTADAVQPTRGVIVHRGIGTAGLAVLQLDYPNA